MDLLSRSGESSERPIFGGEIKDMYAPTSFLLCVPGQAGYVRHARTRPASDAAGRDPGL